MVDLMATRRDDLTTTRSDDLMATRRAGFDDDLMSPQQQDVVTSTASAGPKSAMKPLVQDAPVV